MTTPILLFTLTVIGMLLLAVVLHIVPMLGGFGRAIADRCIRAPGLDLIVFAFTTVPQIVGIVVGVQHYDDGLGWLKGFGIGLAGQIVGFVLWTIGHEIAHRDKTRGPRIVKFLNNHVGLVPNFVAVWWTALAVPVFTLIRLAEYIVYPPLIWLVKFPRYRPGDWINVSRQKFDGLVGHDLIWCLYCDWMTGVWSLGGEMLRNVESFWCPIRFGSPEKCANCVVDYPDIDGGWTPFDKNIADVVDTLDEQYTGQKVNSWFGHKARLTINGAEPAASPRDGE